MRWIMPSCHPMTDTVEFFPGEILAREINLIVFDWDGTLMDSEAQIVSCLRAAVSDLSLEPMDDETLRNVIGLGLREAIDTLVPGRDEVFLPVFHRQLPAPLVQLRRVQSVCGCA